MVWLVPLVLFMHMYVVSECDAFTVTCCNTLLHYDLFLMHTFYYHTYTIIIIIFNFKMALFFGTLVV